MQHKEPSKFTSGRYSLLILLSVFFGTLFALSACFGSGELRAQERTVYITIDDGPLAGFNNILEVIEQEKVPVTLFMVGEHFEMHKSDAKELLERVKSNPYVFLGNHSFYHAHDHYQAFYSDPNEVIEDMTKNARYLGMSLNPNFSRLPGRDVFRLPKLSYDDHFISARERMRESRDYDLLYKKGFYLFGWDLEWSHKTTGEPIQSIPELMREVRDFFDSNKTHLHNHLLLLMHDEMFSDHFDGKNNLLALFRSIKESGYTLKTVDSYPAALR